jgi:di/tricarboxylate transporter
VTAGSLSLEQALLFAILASALALFVWGRWRHDMVSLAALLASVVAGLVPAGEAFAGFGHPAVITVACVLVLSSGLQASGAIDVAARRLLPTGAPPVVLLAAICGLAALLSAFMNNVGALALTMPLTIQAATRAGWPPGRMLMPLAFASILGGMTTLIGTPPNLIVSAFREEALDAPYTMFAFAPVGVAVAIAGTAFVALVGWRLVPARKREGVEGFEAGAYVTEALVPEASPIVGLTLAEVEEKLETADALVTGLVRREVSLRAPRPGIRVRAGDILTLEAEPEALTEALGALGLRLAEAEAATREKAAEDAANPSGARTETPRPDDAGSRLTELVVPPGAALIRRSATGLALRSRYGINLLAVSRQGRRQVGRLKRLRFAAGDVLLMQGLPEAVAGFAAEHGCLPLAERPLRLPDPRRQLLAVGIFLAAIGATATGLVPAAIAFAGGVLAAMATEVVPPRQVYQTIDWPVIVLLAALLPVAGAMETTGGADLLAGLLVEAVAGWGSVAVLAAILVLTMTLSDLMNNAATVAVMAPVALGAAAATGANPDAFLMAVAIGGSCAFLTPIGHQNNTLILGPGGLRFGDYWRLGLPLELLVLAVAIPMILLVWPL